jgi:transposase
MNQSEVAIVDQQALVEYRYRAVREVLGGSPIGEVAVRYGTTRQSLHTWKQRFEQQGMVGLPGPITPAGEQPEADVRRN